MANLQNKNENWCPVPGYESYYVVSNAGDVKSVPRILTNKIGVTKRYKQREMSLQSDADGYKLAPMSKEAKTVLMKVHRIVALTFIPNPNNYEQVNHINGKKDDNRAENLEWCTSSMNRKHSYRVLKNQHPKGMTGMSGRLSPTAKKIIHKKDGNDTVFYGAGEVKKAFNIPQWRIYDIIKSGKEWNGLLFYVDNSNDIPMQDGTL
jgi:hypothetical protein